MVPMYFIPLQAVLPNLMYYYQTFNGNAATSILIQFFPHGYKKKPTS